jgi:hypothetical protein
MAMKLSGGGTRVVSPPDDIDGGSQCPLKKGVLLLISVEDFLDGAVNFPIQHTWIAKCE